MGVDILPLGVDFWTLCERMLGVWELNWDLLASILALRASRSQILVSVVRLWPSCNQSWASIIGQFWASGGRVWVSFLLWVDFRFLETIWAAECRWWVSDKRLWSSRSQFWSLGFDFKYRGIVFIPPVFDFVPGRLDFCALGVEFLPLRVEFWLLWLNLGLSEYILILWQSTFDLWESI